MITEKLHTVCEHNKCNGCQACLDICSKKAITVVDDIVAFNAVIDDSLCVGCGRCEKVCPNNSRPQAAIPMKWYQGWAKDVLIRTSSSSGGLATAISEGFIKNGGVVCSCLFEAGEFRFKIAYDVEGIQKFSGSKYVKSNPVGAYQRIKEEIKQEKRVLFIGLPCQSAALQNYIGQSPLLYTVDLICHGTPSPQLLSMFLEERGYDIQKIDNLTFRDKANFHLSTGYKGIEPSTVKDRYTQSFLTGLCYTENCYSCQYASTQRVSDITLGDSWGSKLPKEEQDKGISLILCQNAKGQELLEMANVHLEDVEVDNAIAHNKQLNAASSKPLEHELFFNEIKKKNNFCKAVRKSFPKFCFRQDVKGVLMRIKRGGGYRH